MGAQWHNYSSIRLERLAPLSLPFHVFFAIKEFIEGGFGGGGALVLGIHFTALRVLTIVSWCCVV